MKELNTKVYYDKNNKLIIENAEIMRGSFRNFAGAAGTYNKEGDRFFNVYVDDIENPEFVNQLKEEGWNVKIRKPREGDEGPARHFLRVNVSYKREGFQPKIVRHISGKPFRVTEEDVAELDKDSFVTSDIAINPYHWQRPDGNKGISAYLNEMHVVVEPSPFDIKYQEEYEEEL